jgi:hypothetical protein
VAERFLAQLRVVVDGVRDLVVLVHGPAAVLDRRDHLVLHAHLDVLRLFLGFGIGHFARQLAARLLYLYVDLGELLDFLVADLALLRGGWRLRRLLLSEQQAAACNESEAGDGCDD